MQTLWSRVAQARGTCKCPHCMHYVKGVSRRAGASAARTNARYMISSTFWYSGIFAAAATWDAGRKQKRRDQWDRAIADLRVDIGGKEIVGERVEIGGKESVEEEDAEAYQPFGGTVVEEGNAAVGANLLGEEGGIGGRLVVNASYGARKERETDFNGETTTYRTFESLEFDADNPLYDPAYVGRRAEWTANTGQQLNTFNLAPQSIYATDGRRAQGEQQLWSSKKVATVQASIEVCLTRIFAELQQRESLDEALQDLPEHFTDRISRNADDLDRQTFARFAHLRDIKRSTDEEELDDILEKAVHNPDLRDSLCSYGQDASGSHRTTLGRLNQSLQRLFDEHKKVLSMSAATLLGRICYNLSLSSAPPNVDTYNILLLGLLALKEHRMVDFIIHSAFESHIRINEITNNAILRHNIATNRPDHFVRHLGRIRGEHGGTMLARSDLKVDETNNSRLRRIGENMEKTVQLPHPCPHIMHAIIAGVVKFFGFESALAMIEQMQQDGWGLNMAGMGPLLENCAERGDWDSGTQIWMHILSLKTLSRRTLGGVPTYGKISRQAYRGMLKLCLACEQPERYEHTWNMLRAQHGGKVTERVTRDARGEEFAVTEGQEQSSSGIGRIDTAEMDDVAASGVVGAVPAELTSVPDEALTVPPGHDPPTADTIHIKRTQTRMKTAPQPPSKEKPTGIVQLGDELDAYEIGERPMELRG